MSSTGARGRKSVEGRVIDGLIKNEEEFIQSLKVFGSGNGVGSNPGEGLGGSLPAAGEASNARITNLGDLSDPFEIDFATMSIDFISAKIIQNTSITFTNIPIDLFMNLRLYIRTTDPIITIDGNIASGVGSSPLVTTAIDDFLDISLKSTDQINVSFEVVKKNDEAAIAPGIPINVQAIGNSPSTINVIWDPPPIGSQPITYDVAFSLTSGGTAANGPTTHAPGSPDNDIATNEHLITGLVSATTYFVWIRAKNSEGNSDYIGPFQTNTDGISNPGGVNFAIPGGSVLYNSITATWDQPGGALFTLTRTNTVSGEVEILQDFDASDADIVDNNGIIANTNYDYKLIVWNGFGANIGQATINVTSALLPAPVFVLSAVGRQLKFNITFPPNIRQAIFEYALDAAFTNRLVTEQANRPVENWDIAGSHDFLTSEKIQNTQYFGRVRFILFKETGPNAANQDVTTGTLSIPAQPTLTVTSPASGQVRIKVKYNDATTKDESALCTWRLASSVQEYFDTITRPVAGAIDNNYARNAPPDDDLNATEDRVEVIRDGGFSPGDNITVRCVATNSVGTSAAETKNVLIDV